MIRCCLLAVFFSTLLSMAGFADEQPLKVATFEADVTPPLGSPLCFGAIDPAKEIVDPLYARGIVLSGAGRPIVLCAVDWVLLNNAGHDEFVAELAKAAETTKDRVSVHTLHPHDTPCCDFDAERLLAEHGLAGVAMHAPSLHEAIQRTAAAVTAACKHPRPWTHVGIGRGKVEKVASNRRILGPDGKVKIVRYSAATDPEAIAAPEGVIDPYVCDVSLWAGEQPLVSITHYATHPQSHYGKGGVSADFVGMARQMRQDVLPAVFHLHFCGAAGNVAAGKYNNGEHALRPILARRLAAGMQTAWDSTKTSPIRAADVHWRTVAVTLPLRDTISDESKLRGQLENKDAKPLQRARVAMDLAYVQRVKAGRKIDLHALALGPATILYLPGELFVEYQLAAQKLRPERTIAVAAYGDGGPGYIGTKVAYSQGGYETSGVSRTSPEVEAVLTDAIARLLAD